MFGVVSTKTLSIDAGTGATGREMSTNCKGACAEPVNPDYRTPTHLNMVAN